MNTSLRISFLFLLLIIPQHGNSPLPVMESWLKKDQDDGFVQRDMTSSLTGGDESFGSAHQTYQNSLIRKKKSENSGNSLPSANYRKFIGKADLSQRYDQPQMIYDRRYVPNSYNARVENNEPQDDSTLDDKTNEMWLPADIYRSRVAKAKDQKIENVDPRLYDKFNSDKFEDLTSSNDMMQYNQMGQIPFGRSNLNPFSDDMRRNKWSLCKRMKERYSPNQPLGMESVPDENQENYESLSYQDKYSGMYSGRDIDNPFKEINQMGNRPEEKSPQIYNENDYYNIESNSMAGENGEEDEDYNQMISDHTQMNKRDGIKQEQRLPIVQENVELNENDLKVGLPNLGGNAKSVSSDETKLVKEDMVREMRKPFQSNTANIKASPDSDLMWKMNSNLQPKNLQDAMRNSQRALQEVHLYQQKLSLRSPDNGEAGGNTRVSRHQPSNNWENKRGKFDEKRLKREDEDEQKNMKTGTDEGGGGEYEDEEGKGHKDEEEYYEDADLSEGESENGGSSRENDLNQKYVKREANKAPRSKKCEKSLTSQDYELSLENAPVENSEKSKSSLHGDGENTKKNSARKGVKIWDQWGKWSACSVTCGVGRSTRWRHCIGGGCAQGEKEAQIKRCTNPAC